ncbi:MULTISPECIES: hypothetical protein, partial [Acinetobacter]|uniref:hypothetical protein n=1 Tax=Acinetobacter TaxID=469 RepID=UPI0005380FB6
MNERGVYLFSIIALFLVLWLIGFQIHEEIYREDLGLNYVYVPTGVLLHGKTLAISRSSESVESVSEARQHQGNSPYLLPPQTQERNRFLTDYYNMLDALRSGKKPEYLQLRTFLNKQQKMLENNTLKHEEAQENIRLLLAYLPEYQHELYRAIARLRTRYA